MWWREIDALGQAVLARLEEAAVDRSGLIEDGATIDESAGPVRIGAGSRVCAGAIIRGPAVIGRDCLVGNNSLLRGPLLIGDGARIGYATEIKNAIIGDGATIGPMCFVADSRVDRGAYLGAMVRTSNQRLDRAVVGVAHRGRIVPSGRDKLGCWIGENAALGIQVIVLPGRVVAPGSLFEPRITISRNYPAGHYRATQAVEPVEGRKAA